MSRVVALYRYPVKSFTPESCTALRILPDGRVAGDRVLGFRFANSPFADYAWSRKYEFVALVNTPALARLALRFDHRALRLRIGEGSAVLADAGLDEAGRIRLAAAVAEYVLAQAENPLSGHPERLPLRLIGDGATPRYQDNETGQITLHSRASLAAVAGAANEAGLSELRFRSNVVIEGVPAWEEQSWIGRRLRIGEVPFDVARPKVRCLATHANPSTGVRDVPLMPMLVQSFRQEQPTFGVGMLTYGAGGEIRLGDEVTLL
ncbi:MAG: MOSC domain-containing protein [Betaproteobacteria bacterium]